VYESFPNSHHWAILREQIGTGGRSLHCHNGITCDQTCRLTIRSVVSLAVATGVLH
jgi:hypothetical protein